jgi:hypothetical protein
MNITFQADNDLNVGDAANWLYLIWEGSRPEEYANRIELITRRF